MSFGFQVFDENGGLALDDKSFSIIGRAVTLSGDGAFPLYPEFVALGASGEALVGKNLFWYIGGGSVHYSILNGGGVLDVIIFEDSSKSAANPVMGLEVFSESGVKTFSSGDRHFEIISQTPVLNYLPNYGDPPSQFSETLNRKTVYILHSPRWTTIKFVPQPYGVIVGMDSLSANNQTILVKPRAVNNIQGLIPHGLDQTMRTTPSSQLLRVRAK